MASTSDTGHAKNVANFESLISFCTGYGAAYNPSNADLQLANLQTLRTTALADLQNVKVTKTAFDNATNTRQQVFKPLRQLATRIINALAASGAQAEVIADARTINRKIQGKAKDEQPVIIPSATTPPTPVVTPTDKKISTSQQSFDNLIDHLTQLIQLLTQESNYTPNEPDLTVAALTNTLNSLIKANTLVINAYTAWSNARIERNDTLYNPLTGLVQTALEVKQYVKSIFNASSPQYKQVSKLQFKTRTDL